MQISLQTDGPCTIRGMQKSNATYRTAIVSGLMLLLLLSSACSEPDGLAPEEVSRKFMEAVAKPDADEARKYVTFSSKLLVTVDQIIYRGRRRINRRLRQSRPATRKIEGSGREYSLQRGGRGSRDSALFLCRQ